MLSFKIDLEFLSNEAIHKLLLQRGHNVFLKVATTLVELLCIELMLHLSPVKQMDSQPINITHELMLCIQITRDRVDFNRDPALKSPCWHQV